ncbi:hypothetical protein [Erythrobacter longus]|uniref:hypothetical protein n=1 Tax=Erythrobacter longus TaxID=1044 RepID=UPI0019D7095A|nr:hypothetical protein [Erythrobacter longus]
MNFENGGGSLDCFVGIPWLRAGRARQLPQRAVGITNSFALGLDARMVLGNRSRRPLGKTLAQSFSQGLEFPLTSRHHFEELNGQSSRHMGRGFTAGIFIRFRAFKATHRDLCADRVDPKSLSKPYDFIELQFALLDALVEPMAVAALNNPLIDEASDADALLLHLKPYEDGIFTVHLSARFFLNTPWPLIHDPSLYTGYAHAYCG